MNRASKKKSDLQACANQKLGINVMGSQFIQILQKECVRKIYMITAPMAMDPASFGLHAALTYEEVRQTAQLHRLGEEDSIGRPVRLSSGSPGCLGEHNGIREGGQGISFLASSHAKGCGPEGQEHHLSRISHAAVPDRMPKCCRSAQAAARGSVGAATGTSTQEDRERRRPDEHAVFLRCGVQGPI